MQRKVNEDKMEQQVKEYLSEKGQQFSDEKAEQEALKLIAKHRQDNQGMEFKTFLGWIHLGGMVVPIMKSNGR